MLGEETEKSGPEAFVQSELFARTFREGMQLVEETANYLDGPGRDAAEDLSRDNALAYAGASMRLTTQLMQIASWLLVLRAVREGEMNLVEASDAKYRIEDGGSDNADHLEDELPPELGMLIRDARQLYDRIRRLDIDLFTSDIESGRDSDAIGQQRALLKAFGG